MDLQQALARLVAGDNLERAEMAAVMRAVMSGDASLSLTRGRSCMKN